MDFGIEFEIELPHGLCVGVRIPDRGEGSDRPAAGEEAMARLTEHERRHAGSLHDLRRRSWIAGRLAMRAALERMGVRPHAIMPDPRGAPCLPGGVVGSISHKSTLAVAMAAADTGWTLGVDLEKRAPSAYDIARRVLTEEEHAEVAGLTRAEQGLAVMLRFSLKEAVYKAIDPWVKRYVGFREVSVAFPAGDLALVRHALAEPLEIEARWTVLGEFFLTSARARL